MAACNDDYHVIYGIVGKFLSIEPQENEKESHRSLSTIADAYTNCRRQLRAACEDKDMVADHLWIHLAKQRMPEATLDSWEQHRNRHDVNELPTGDEFGRFLTMKAKGRREFESDTDWNKQTTGGGRAKAESNGSRFRPYDRNNDRDRSFSSSARLYGNRDMGQVISAHEE